MAKWHTENDDELRRFLISIALPHTVEPLNAENRERVTTWFDVFEECLPTITAQDIMGLIVLRLTQEFLPLGEVTELDSALANLKGLSLAIQAAPDRMQAAGFAVPPIALPDRVEERALFESALRVRHRWLDWFRSVLDPYRPHRNERELIVRGLARLKCFRKTVGEAAAAREARKLLDADLRRRGRGGANVDAADIIGELYTLGRGEVGKSRLLRLRKDGSFAYRPRAMRDVVRKAEHGQSIKPQAMQKIVDREAEQGKYAEPDLGERMDIADLRARIIDQCDSTDAFIVEHWDKADAALGRDIGMTGQAIGMRRRRIEERVRRLGSDPRA